MVEQDGYRGVGVPIKLSRTPGRAAAPPSPAGGDTKEVLAAAGCTPEEIAEALEGGAVVARDGGPSTPRWEYSARSSRRSTDSGDAQNSPLVGYSTTRPP
ncbi:hypothetical protein ACWD2L_34540 [Streptomyces sp. NPDC002754]